MTKEPDRAAARSEASSIPSNVYYWRLPRLYDLEDNILAQFRYDLDACLEFGHWIATRSRQKGGFSIAVSELFEELERRLEPIESGSFGSDSLDRAYARYLAKERVDRNDGMQILEHYLSRESDREIAVGADSVLNQFVGRITRVVDRAETEMREFGLGNERRDHLFGVYSIAKYLAEIIDGTKGTTYTQLQKRIEKLRAEYSHRPEYGVHDSVAAEFLSVLQSLSVKISITPRVTMLVGEAGSGKTLSCFHAAKSFKWCAFVNGGSLTKLTLSAIGDSLCAEFALKSRHDIYSHIRKLEHLYGRGLIVIDGLDEVQGFRIRDVEPLLAELSFMPGAFPVLVTCRLGSIAEQAIDRLEYGEYLRRFERQARVIYVGAMRERPIVDWLDVYCKCYGVSKMGLHVAWSRISSRFRPRDIRVLFDALRKWGQTQERAYSEIAIGDALIACCWYLIDEILERGKTGEDRNAIRDALSSLCEGYWAEFAAKGKVVDLAVSGATVNKKIARYLEMNLSVLYRGNDLGYNWEVSDVPFMQVACTYLNRESGGGANRYVELIGGLALKYRHYAPDVFMNMLRAAFVAARTPIAVGGERWASIGDSFRETVEANTSEDLLGDYSRVALALYQYENGGSVKELEDLLSGEPVRLSEFTAIDLIVAIGESLVLRCGDAKTDRIARVIDLVETVGGNIGGDRYEGVTVDVASIIERILSQGAAFGFGDLGCVMLISRAARIGGVIADKIVAFVLKFVAGSPSREVYDEAFYLLGESDCCWETRWLARTLGARVANASWLPLWLGSAESRMYRSGAFYARKEVVNRFADCARGNRREDGDRLVDEVRSKLVQGSFEQRRNAIFLIQRFFGKQQKKIQEGLRAIAAGETDAELCSTIVGIAYDLAVAEKKMRKSGRSAALRPPLMRFADWFAPAVWEAAGEEIEQKFKEVANYDEFLFVVERYRGLVEVHEGILHAAIKCADTIPVNIVGVTAFEKTVRLLEEEPHKVNMRKVLAMASFSCGDFRLRALF
ncbi:MAG: hypothetical protein ABIK96_03020 [bacterium]